MINTFKYIKDEDVENVENNKNNKGKEMTLYEKWDFDSKSDNPVNFAEEKTEDSIRRAIDRIEYYEGELNKKKVSKDEMKKIKNVVDELAEQLNVLNENEIEEKLDEGLPSESGKYISMDYEEILARALQMENDAVEINLMLLEIAPDEDRKKFVEIANDENDHSLIYQGILNRIKGTTN